MGARVAVESALEFTWNMRLYRAGVEPAGVRRKDSVHFILLSTTYPDARGFLLRQKWGSITSTATQEDLEVRLKTERLKQWREDINHVQWDVTYNFVFVDEESFSSYSPNSIADLAANFRQYKE